MIKQINIAQEFGEIENLVRTLSAEDQKWNIDKVSPWDQEFRDYVNRIKNDERSFEELMSNETYFRDKFTQFLYSPRGGIFQVCNNTLDWNSISKIISRQTFGSLKTSNVENLHQMYYFRHCHTLTRGVISKLFIYNFHLF